MPTTAFLRLTIGRTATAATIAMMLALAPFASARSSAADAPVVQTKSGPVAGTLAAGVSSYEGIPYVAPPTGDRRWKPPVPPAPWTSPLRANDFGPSCPQQELPERVLPSSRAATMSEDCLTLNVWSPEPHGTKLPVMVWIHGGGNTGGTSAISFYDGTAFARDGVVLVSFNYRLGLLGFFAHPAITAEAAAAPAGSPAARLANYGLMDQVAALDWVRDNIAQFGGDPARVTLFGESAGGEDTVMLDSMSAARGLFARAIAESAATIQGPFPTLAAEEQADSKNVTALGVPGARATARELRALPADTLAKAKYGYADAGPIVDGSFVTGAPATVLATSPGVPLVIGTNDGEYSLVGKMHDPKLFFPDLSAGDLAALTGAYARIGISGDAALTQHIFMDGYFSAPTREIGRRYAASGVPAYLYRFDYIASFFEGVRPAANHGSEIPFVFESFSDEGLLSADDRAIQAAMHGCWVAFAKTGVPSCPGLPSWSAYDPHAGTVMVIDAHPSMRDPGTNAVLDIIDRTLEPKR